MKVGIITFHRVLNYGAVLQTYALQTCIKSLGYDCIVVDYRKLEFEQEYRNLKITRLKPRDIYHTLKCWMVRKKDKAFLEFIYKRLEMTSACTTNRELSEATIDCDLIITGSDQVFNYLTTKDDGHFFLDFAKGKRKCSYAASFGFTDFSKDYDKKIESWLKDFEYISVREIEAQKYLSGLLNKEISLHCDPSFLLTKKEWESFRKGKPEKDYILVYSVGKSRELLECANKLAKAHDLEILYIKYTYGYCGKAKVITDASPEDFVNLILQARYVVTNLFHGVAFSIILEKDFYVSLQEGVRTNSRLIYLLERYGLSNRLVNSSSEIEETPIDYSVVRKEIEKERLLAKAFLKRLGE